MKSIRLKYILLVFIFSHHIALATSATTNDKLLVAAGFVTTALMSSAFDRYYPWSPSALALLTGILLIALTPTSSGEGEGVAANTCTAPGFANDPVLGCIRFYKYLRVQNIDEMIRQCASDGGALLLVNSAAENTALVSLMNSEDVGNAAIQGSRVTFNAPWLTDSGQPLPYIGPGAELPATVGTTSLLTRVDGSWTAVNPRTVAYRNAVCEIL